MPEYQQFFVTWEDAQPLKAISKELEDHPETPRHVKPRLRRIRMELGRVRKDVDYAPFKGYQLLLSPVDADVFRTVLEIAGMA